MPTTSVSRPSGNGGLSGVPSTKCVSAVGMASGRPGSASSGATILVFEPRRNICLTVGRAAVSLLVLARAGHGLEQLQRGGLGRRDEHLAVDVLELREEAGVDGDLVLAGVL